MSLHSAAENQATTADVTAVTPVTAGSAAVVTRVRAAVRVSSIDMLRGLVIVIMALDHVRHYFTNVQFDALDLAQTTPQLFFTRWITHYCAPIFVFLAGASAWMVGQRCTRAELSKFLFTRGLWLVVLECTVVNWAWMGNMAYEVGLFLQVIWAIGISMMLMAGLIHLSVRTVGIVAVVLIAGHNLLDGIQPASFGSFALLWQFLHVKTLTSFGLISYPIVPWIGVMALGYALGGVFALEERARRRILVSLGLGFIAAFMVLRFVNVYGDPKPWKEQASALYTVFSFVNVYKYPPSLLYALMTLGPGLLLVAGLDKVRGRFAGVLETFGRVPLFVYVLHIYFAHWLAGLTALAMGYGTTVLTQFPLQFPENWGFGLVGVYIAWLAVLVLLYPLAKWFADVKRRRRDWWLSYL